MPTRGVLALFGNFCKFRFNVSKQATPRPLFEGGRLKKKMFWKEFRWVGWVLGPSKGLEGLNIGHSIILRRLLKK